MNNTIIEFGITKKYISDWTVTDALREIYQNFIDFSYYQEEKHDTGEVLVDYKITNNFNPENLDFLTLGYSNKKEGAIGKHGEGLKMAMLVFLRNNLSIYITCSKYTIKPVWVKKDDIEDEIFAISVSYNFPIVEKVFEVSFTIPIEAESYVNSILKDKDILFSTPIGNVIDYPKGTLYVGKLYCATLKGLSNAYSLKPSILPLDRDRKIPPSFEVSYYTSQINEKYLKQQKTFNIQTLGYDDTKYLTSLPDSFVSKVKPVILHNTVKYAINTINEETKEEITTIIEQPNIVEVFKKSSLLNKIVVKLASLLLKGTKVQVLVQEFYDTYCHTLEAKNKFEIIMARFAITLDKKEN